MLILDPPIHIRKGYYPYDSGIKNNVFITDISGKPYVGQVSQLLYTAACSASSDNVSLVCLQRYTFILVLQQCDKLT